MEANITPTKIRCINRWFLKTKWLVSTCQWNKSKSKTTSLLDPTILCVSFPASNTTNTMPMAIHIYSQIGEFCLVDQLSQQWEATAPRFYYLLFLEQSGHLYCFIWSAFAGVILTHLPWNHCSQMSHPIQNSFELYKPLQVPQRVSLCSSSSSYPSSTAADLEFFILPSLDRCITK